jgi:cytochrome c oxidase cbb3-type subunit I/II
VYDHPFLWGSRRIGPDLAREGGKYNDIWHLRHFENPQAISPKSMMPSYAQLLTSTLDFDQIQHRVDVMSMLGVPYGAAVTTGAQLARDQASQVASSLQQQGAQGGLQDKEIVALIAYIQRLGQDIKGAPVVSTPAPAGAGVAAAAGARP